MFNVQYVENTVSDNKTNISTDFQSLLYHSCCFIFSFFHHNIIANKPYPKKPPIKKHNNHNSNLLKNFIYSLNILFTFFFNVFIFNISVIIITLSQSPFKIFICRNWFKLVWLICKVFYHHITAGINKIWH